MAGFEVPGEPYSGTAINIIQTPYCSPSVVKALACSVGSSLGFGANEKPMKVGSYLLNCLVF